MWVSPSDDKPYSHRDYDPFWAAAQDLDMPISLHILTGRRGTGVDRRHVLRSYMSLPHSIQVSFAELVLAGVLVCYPRFTLVSTENAIAWMLHFFYRPPQASEGLRHPEPGQVPLKPRICTE